MDEKHGCVACERMALIAALPELIDANAFSSALFIC